MTKLELRGTPSQIQMMSGDGHDTLDYNPEDDESIKKILEKTIIPALKSGKILYAGKAGRAGKDGQDLHKIADKNDLEIIMGLKETMKKDAYDRFVLASKHERVLLGAEPGGG